MDTEFVRFDPEDGRKYARKFRECNKAIDRNIRGLAGGLVVGISTVLPGIFGFVYETSREKPKIIVEYDEKKATLDSLKSLKQNMLGPNISYSSKEVEELLEDVFRENREKVGNLEKAIAIVESDIGEMKDNSEYVEYWENKRERGAVYFGLILGGVSFMVASTLFGAVRVNSIRRKLRKLGEK